MDATTQTERRPLATPAPRWELWITIATLAAGVVWSQSRLEARVDSQDERTAAVAEMRERLARVETKLDMLIAAPRRGE